MQLEIKLRLKYSEKFKIQQNNTNMQKMKQPLTCRAMGYWTILEDPGMVQGEACLIFLTSCFDYILRYSRRTSVEYIHSVFNKLISQVHVNEPRSPPLPSSLPSHVHPRSIDASSAGHQGQVPSLPSLALPLSHILILPWKQPTKPTLCHSENTCSQQVGCIRPTSLPWHSQAAISSFLIDLGKQSTLRHLLCHPISLPAQDVSRLLPHLSSLLPILGLFLCISTPSAECD